MRSRICSTALGIVLVLTAAVARGQSAADKKQAQALVVAGVHLMDTGDNRGAIGKFDEAFKLFPSPKILFNMGRAHYALHEEVDALTDFERFLDESPYAPKESRAEAERVIAELRPRLSYLDLDVEDTGSHISIDGREVGTAPLARPVVVAPGAHEVRVEKAGLLPAIRNVSPVPGQKLRLALKLVAATETAPPPVAATPANPASSTPTAPGSALSTTGEASPSTTTAPVVVASNPPAQPSHPATWHTTAAWISAGAGALFLAGGIAAQVASSSKNADFNAVKDSSGNSQCNQTRPDNGGGPCSSLLDSANSRHTLAIVAFVASGAALGAALTFYLTSPTGGGSARDVAALCLPNSESSGVSCALSMKF
jgi:hypothetical protein